MRTLNEHWQSRCSDLYGLKDDQLHSPDLTGITMGMCHSLLVGARNQRHTVRCSRERYPVEHRATNEGA
jgi:hypothetical protein